MRYCNSGGNSSSGTPSFCCCLRAERFSGVKYLTKGGGAGKAEDTREEDPICSADMGGLSRVNSGVAVPRTQP